MKKTEVVVGKITGVYGLSGWLKILSYTRPVENILQYAQLCLTVRGKTHSVQITQARRQSKGVLARIEGCDTRDEAQQWVGALIGVDRDQLPNPGQDYYWVDLVGCSVRTVEGEELGDVSRLFETGANDVMVVEGAQQCLIPFVLEQVVVQVDLVQQRIVVDWDPIF